MYLKKENIKIHFENKYALLIVVSLIVGALQGTFGIGGGAILVNLFF
jgi:uncharacterized membrane protein YfcA